LDGIIDMSEEIRGAAVHFFKVLTAEMLP